ncbi:MAG: hypothetical protein IKU39_01420 [Lachnospiraceae bacterium]|nr:hypothetical protein [Lachnospiraceae bacterium]
MENTSKKKSPRLQLIISIMITVALFLAELYVMINESKNVVLVVGIAVLILIAIYFVVDAILDGVNEQDIEVRELYDNIYRSEKASYMLLKKNLGELSKQINGMDKAADKPEIDLSEITKAQKAIAKVAMNKNKDTQDRLFIELNNLEASLNDSVRGLSEKLSGFQEEIERLADHIARINEEAIMAASKNSQDIRTIVSEKETVAIDEIEENILEDSIVDDVVLEESLFDEIVLDTDVSDAEEVEENLEFESIDLNGLDLDVSSPIESDEDVLSQLLATEEAPVEEEIDVLAELTKAMEEVPVVEPTPEPIPTPAPAPADNGGKMGQDDIAALIASMTGGDSAPTPEPEPVPTPTPASADNGGKMGQDDIAALIASMTGGDSAPTPEPEPVPTPTPAPADNGGKMNQDDIAALIASMTN